MNANKHRGPPWAHYEIPGETEVRIKVGEGEPLRLAEGRLTGWGERRPGSIHSVKPQQCAESSVSERNLGTGKKGLPRKVHFKKRP